jgi:hypothetical protein
VVLTHARQTDLLLVVCISLAEPLFTPPFALQMSTVASTVRAGARDPSGTYVRAPTSRRAPQEWLKLGVGHRSRLAAQISYFTCSSVDVRTRMRPRSVHVTYINSITDLPCAISMKDICVVCIQCSRWKAPFTCMSLARFVMIDSFTAHTRHKPCDSTSHWTPVVCCSLRGHSVCCS